MAAGPALYPLYLALATRRSAKSNEPPAANVQPPLSIIVPAYLEAREIAAKVEDLLNNGYLGTLEVIVVAEDPDTARVAGRVGARVVTAGERLGKAEAINRGMAVAEHDVAVLTDADTRLRPGSLAALAGWFADPSVGAVAGEKQVLGSEQALYWRYESWLKRREGRLGATVSLVGELIALRRSAFSPIPPDVAVDDLWIGLDITGLGLRVPYEPAAIAYEPPSSGLRAEWERRTRTTAGLLDAVWRRRGLLLPGKRPVARQLWGHKLFRLLLGPLAHSALLLQAVLAARASKAARGFLILHALAALALVRQRRGGASTSTLGRASAQALFLQASAVGGIIRYANGDRPALWPKADRSSSD